MNIFSVLCLIFASRRVLSEKDVLPVFITDYRNILDDITVDANPFSVVSNLVFADIIYTAIKKSAIILVFVEELLSVEDISVKDKFGTPFLYLHKDLLDEHVKYLPKVANPYKTLVKIFQPKQSNTHNLTSSTKIRIKDISHNLYVFFRDGVNESRVAALRRHDMLMNEVRIAITQQAARNVVSFYTGIVNPVKFQKFEKVPIDKIAMKIPPGVMVVTDGALFKFKGVSAATHVRSAHFNHAPLVAEESWSSETLSTKMAYPDFELEFQFSFRDQSWMLDAVALLEDGEKVGSTEMGVGAPWNSAFYCAQPLVVVNKRDGSAVTISEYKIQPLKHRRHSITRFKAARPNKIPQPGSPEEKRVKDKTRTGDTEPTEPVASEPSEGEADKFGDTVNCAPYFSSAILAGLFVVLVFLIILSFGLLALSNCASEDRFDDPHGKPLVISAEQ